MECSICIETFTDKLTFKCNACKYINCIECHKKYLLTSNQDPHCISCRSVISYDIFIDKFNEKWIFDKYKKHRYEILWEKEKSLIPQTVRYIGLKKQEAVLIEEKNKLIEQVRKINDSIYLLNNDALNLNTKAVTNKFKYTYSCPKQECKGFLNEENICEICDITVCKKCYTEIEKDLKGPHECIPELVETFNAIKKEAKPCPSCGEFISKISGCDQMFCITCGTAFSWKSGMIEKGIIHNPHAHTFFQNNPTAQQNYINNQNHNQNNGCRTPIPAYTFFENINKKIFFDEVDYIKIIHRNIAEFRQYFRNRFINYLANNTDKNQDIRIRFINNDIDQHSFKKILHSRDKKIYYLKQVLNTLINTYEISEIILWNIIDNISFIDIIDNNIISLIQLADDTNILLNNISDDFNYSSKVSFSKHFKFPYFSI